MEREQFTVTVSDSFESQHALEDYNGPCRNSHGHSFHVDVSWRTTTINQHNISIDFGIVKNMVRELTKQLDHHSLNKVVDTKNPTAEVIARWFWDRLYIKQFGDYLHQIDIWETATNKLSYFQLVSPIKKPIEEDQRASVPCGLSNT